MTHESFLTFWHRWHLLTALPINDVALISSRRCWLRWAVAMASASSGSAALGVASAKLRAFVLSIYI